MCAPNRVRRHSLQWTTSTFMWNNIPSMTDTYVSKLAAAISSQPAPKSLAHRSHLYFKHHVEPCHTKEMKKASIDDKFCSVGQGKTWCSVSPIAKIGHCVEDLDHFERHIRHGSAIVIPGQTKYPVTNQARDAWAETLARSANESEDICRLAFLSNSILW